MKNLLIASFCISTLFLLSCDPEPSVDVNQDRIKTDYYVSYNDNDEETEASAQFWFGSTPLKITSPAQILAEDVSLKKRDILGFVDYGKTFGEYLPSVTFEYIDHDARTFTNTASVPVEIQLPSSLTSISRSEDLVITWEGEPVQAGESVLLEIIDGDAYWTDSNSNVGSNSFFLAANSLDAEFDGTLKLKITRSKEYELQEYPRGGQITGSYVSKKITVEIVD